VQVRGNIVDVNNEPIPDIIIETGGSFGIMETINDSNRLGDGLSDSSGLFNFISLDTRNSNFNIAINSIDQASHNTAYESVFLIDTTNAFGSFLNFEDAVILRPKLQVELNLSKASAGSEQIDYQIRYVPSGRRFLIEGGQISNQIENINGNGHFNSSLSTSRPERTLLLDLIEGSTILINYVIDGGTAQDSILTPSRTQNSYSIEF